MTTMATAVIRMKHSVDPKELIWKDVKDFTERVTLVNPYEVLLAMYERGSGEAKTLGGIIIPDAYGDEDKFQGIVGLVLKMGELAFQPEDDQYRWGKRVPKINDWVTFRVGDTHPFTVKNRMLRLISCASVRLILDGDPSEVI